MSTSNNLILKNVAVFAGTKRLVEDLNLELEHQKIYTIIGPSGTGKSTLLKVLAGLIPYQKGTISLGNSDYIPKNNLIGLVPQNYGLLPWETALETVTSNVKISKKKRRLTDDEKREIDLLFEAMDLSHLKHSYPSQMSGGQQQRVSLTRGFAVDSNLLLLDEPFSALDAFTRENIQNLFLKNWQKKPTTTVFITHDIEEAILLGHHIVIMKGNPGKIVEVIENPLGAEKDIEKRREAPEFYKFVGQLKKEIAYE